MFDALIDIQMNRTSFKGLFYFLTFMLFVQ